MQKDENLVLRHVVLMPDPRTGSTRTVLATEGPGTPSKLWRAGWFKCPLELRCGSLFPNHTLHGIWRWALGQELGSDQVLRGAWVALVAIQGEEEAQLAALHCVLQWTGSECHQTVPLAGPENLSQLLNVHTDVHACRQLLGPHLPWFHGDLRLTSPIFPELWSPYCR